MSEWTEVITQALQAQVQTLVAFAPRLAGALVILLVGWLLARLARGLARRLTDVAVHRLSKHEDVHRGLHEGRLHERLRDAAGFFTFWSLMLLFAAGAIEQLGIAAVSDLLNSAAYYLPRLLTGLVIVVAGLVAGSLAGSWASATMAPIGVSQAQAAGRVLQVAVVAVACVVAADQIGIQSTFLMLALGITLLVSLGGVVLAFALGCGPVVTNLVAAHYVSKRLKKGQIAGIDQSVGAVADITATFVVLQGEDGETLVPARRFLEESTHIQKGVAR